VGGGILNQSPSTQILPEDPWLRKVISDDEDAEQAWKIIVRLGVDPRVLESRLLGLRESEDPTIGFRALSRKETERGVKRIEHLAKYLDRVAEDIGHFNVELAHVLPGPLPPPGTPLGEMLSRVPPGAQLIRLREWLLHLACALKEWLQQPQRSEKRLRFPDSVHTIGAEIVHLCVVASGFAELDPQGVLRATLQSAGSKVLRVKPNKLPGKPRYWYKQVGALCDAILAGGDALKRPLDVRSLRRAYNSLHPQLAAALKAPKQRARKGNMRRKKA